MEVLCFGAREVQRVSLKRQWGCLLMWGGIVSAQKLNILPYHQHLEAPVSPPLCMPSAAPAKPADMSLPALNTLATSGSEAPVCALVLLQRRWISGPQQVCVLEYAPLPLQEIPCRQQPTATQLNLSTSYINTDLMVVTESD